MKALILAGGELNFNEKILKLCQSSNLVIAADSGLKHAKQLKLKPQIIIGDFDSVDESNLAQFPKIKKLSYPKKKDKLDLELAIDYAFEQNASEILLIAATGGRLDQTMAAIFIAAKIAMTSQISMHSGNEDIFFLSGKSSLSLDILKGQYFSLLSLVDSSIISLKGAQYPLNNSQLDFGLGLGISNVSLNPPIKISLHSGLIAVIVSYI